MVALVGFEGAANNGGGHYHFDQEMNSGEVLYLSFDVLNGINALVERQVQGSDILIHEIEVNQKFHIDQAKGI